MSEVGRTKRKITKRAKKVKIRRIEVTNYISEYKCPSCGTTFKGACVNEKTVRFLCSCGQELICT